MERQLTLDDCIKHVPRFNGSDYSVKNDRERLTGQILRVFNLMKDGHWRTLQQIEDATGDPQASISAQLRNLRKARFGAYQMEKMSLGGGLFTYRLVING